MNYIEKDFGKILKHNALQMRRLTLKNGTDCMRVYDRNLEALPVTVDLYGPYVRITDYSEEGLDDDQRRICCDIAARMLYVQADHVVFHQRKKRLGREQHELQSEESLLVPVMEGGLSFTVDLTKRIDTGLFLDHAQTRAMVRELSSGLSVLNLFAYTGAFSVYAASGGAKRVVSVDMSSTYSQWCEENLRANGFVGPAYPCVTEDAWGYIRRAVKEGESFDLIVFDPPSFSNSRKMEHDFDVQRDHVRWIRLLNRLLTKDGILLFSTNLGTFRMDGRSIRGYEMREITYEVAAPGFSKQKGSTRSWILKKEHEVQIPAEDLREPEVPVSAADADEVAVKTVKKPRKARKKTEAQDAPVEMVQVEEVAMKDETPEVAAVVEEPAEETVAEAMVENEEVVEQGQEPVQDMVAADDLLSLDWNDDDAVSEADDQVPADGVIEMESVPEHGSDRKTEGREERPRRDSRDDDRRDGRSRDRDDRGRSSYGDRDSRPRRDGDRDRRSSYGDRDSRPRRDGDRDRRSSYGDRDSRPRYNDDRRPSYGDRDDRRSSYGDRDSRPRYNDDRRPSYGDRDSRPRYNDDRRPSYGDRDSRPRYNDDRRPSFKDRDDRRSSYGDRDSRPRYNDDRRSSYGDRDSRPRNDDDRRPSYRDRDDRRSFGDRDSRPRYSDDRRPSYGDRDNGRRDDRPYGRREDSDRSFKPRRYDDNGGDRRPWGDRPQRDGGFRKDRKDGDFKRDDRKGFDAPKSKGPKPYGFDQFKATRTRGEEEDNSFFWLSDDEKK